MASYIPITLVGNNLGERHRYLNTLVNDAYQKKVPFQSIQDAPELSAVDRLFKIDLASKLRHKEYILFNLKEDDMLYVSRALQSSWLLESKYHDVINPTYLDKVLYPEMTTTAMNKMNNWLHVHLKDSSRCLEFFQYYSEKNLDIALKFLWNCSEDMIADTIPRMYSKITPKRLKLLSEKCPRAVRMFYYDFLPKNENIFTTYNDWRIEGLFYRSLTKLINTNPDLLLDIAETYYSSYICDPFSSTITRIIMSNHKDRYVKKPELYAAWLLHIPTLAKCLNNDEIKDIVLRLARAEYLGSDFFSYKSVEPFIKQLARHEREIFKKMVFVDKCIGDTIKDWPYTPPSSPCPEVFLRRHVFEDQIYENYGGCDYDDDYVSAKACGYALEKCKMRSRKVCRDEQTLLDKLFNKYRFINFKDTFIELSKQIPCESVVQTREYMMLVLVSKTGGVEEHVKDVLNLLVSKHSNEADNFRATIVRSLVKRAKVWQLPNDLWQLILKFAHGLGLDGEKSDENCVEGLHALVLRNILLAEECSPKVFSTFLDKFSTFIEYTLNEDEKHKVADKLPLMLFASAIEQGNTNEAVVRLEAAMNVLNDYSRKIKDYPDIVPFILMLARKDLKACEGLLRQLYNARIARKELIRENFSFLQNNESYLNVLHHDCQILIETDKFEELAGKNIVHDQFVRKLAIYFSDNQGLAEKYLSIIEKNMAKYPHGDLVKSFAILAGSSVFIKLQEVDRVTDKTAEQKLLAVALRTYGHLARPKLDLSALKWRAAGVKAVANQISTCSAQKVEDHIKALSNWLRASRLTFLLAKRIGKEVEILAKIARARPTVAIKITLCHLKQRRESYIPEIWKIGKSLLENRDLSHPKYMHLRETLSEINNAPESLRADYGAAVYRVLQKVSQEEGMRILFSVEQYLLKADEIIIHDVILKYLDRLLTFENIEKNDYQDKKCAYLILRLIAKYLMHCKSGDIQKQRMEAIGIPFLSHMKILFGKADDVASKSKILNYWYNFMFNLKCTEVFMDTSYTSSLPVMQHIVDWLKDTFSMVEQARVFISMHILMLYFKAIRQSVKQNPDIFSIKEKRNTIGVEIVGFIFGKYIAHEIEQLKAEYFESFVEIYLQVLIKFLTDFQYDDSKWVLASASIRGLLEEGESTSLLLAERVFNVFKTNIMNIKDDKTWSLLQGIEDKQLKFFLNSADMEKIFVD